MKKDYLTLMDECDSLQIIGHRWQVHWDSLLTRWTWYQTPKGKRITKVFEGKSSVSDAFDWILKQKAKYEK